MSGQNLDNDIKVAIARGIHLFPFRTEKLSLVTPMVLRNSGRVGSRRLEARRQPMERSQSIQILYDKGYVLVSPHDMATVNKDGTMSRGKIMVPEGKIPFVLSQDDVSYYHYMDGDGYASRLVLDENGDVKTEYIEDDGSVSVGDYDMVPLLDAFIKEHPDFSYHGENQDQNENDQPGMSFFITFCHIASCLRVCLKNALRKMCVTSCRKPFSDTL